MPDRRTIALRCGVPQFNPGKTTETMERETKATILGVPGLNGDDESNG
jgi:hypothetical protein